MGKMTEAQQAALEFVSLTMGTTARAVGKHVIETIGVRGGSGYVAVGAAVLMHLRRKGLVFPLYNAGWRTTDSGRRALRPSPEDGR